MEKIKKVLKVREKVLLKIKKEKEKSLQRVPEGGLRICCKGNKPQFYHRTDPKDYNGRYISRKEYKLIQRLAQKDYDEKVLRAVEKELRAIERYFALSPKVSVEEVYYGLHKERQKLVIPVQESQEEFIKNWETKEYEGKRFFSGHPEYYTAKGERVRSKSEVIIADSLYRANVPYRYEYPLYLEGLGIIYPDFTVLNVKDRKELYWEHNGMMDDEEYSNRAVNKLSIYQQNNFFSGDNLILTFETSKHPLNQKEIMQLIEKYLL